MPAQFNVCQFHGFRHHAVHVGQSAVGFALFHKGADALDDLARTLRLVGGFLQCRKQRFFRDLPTLDARDHARTVIVDGGERLVEFMRHAGGHFTHGDEAADRLGTLCLPRGLLLSQATGRDVGGNDHLSQAAVHPVQVA